MKSSSWFSPLWNRIWLWGMFCSDNHKCAEHEWVDKCRVKRWKIDKKGKKIKPSTAKPAKFVSENHMQWAYGKIRVCACKPVCCVSDRRTAIITERTREGQHSPFLLKWQQNITLWNLHNFHKYNGCCQNRAYSLLKASRGNVSVTYTHTHTCLDSLMLQGSSLTFDPAVKAVMARHRSCWRICGSTRVHFWENRTDKWLSE